MYRAIVTASLVLAGQIPGQAETRPAGRSEIETVQDLVTAMKAREKSATSAYLEMVTKGSYPGGISFEIEGTVRVLGETQSPTHVQIETVARFGDDVRTEFETVRTPEGVWTREVDPTGEEVFTKMEPELVDRLEEASRLQGLEGAIPSAPGNQAADPLGSRMVESLSEQFDLELERIVRDGVEYWVVKGPLRGEAPTAPADAPSPDAVELLVRARDLVVKRMVQFREGKELMRVEIERLELGRPMDEASFRIERPAGKPLLDVMDHPPAAAHISRILEQAEARKGEGEEKKRAGRSTSRPGKGK